MPDDDFNQVRVIELVDIEFDVEADASTEAIMRLLIRSRIGDRLAVGFPFSDWQTIHKAISAALAKFPGGRLPQ